MSIHSSLSAIWYWIKRNLALTGGLVVLVLLIVDITFGLLNAHDRFTWQTWAQDFYANIATELASIFVTVVLIGWLVERRQREELKHQLIRQLGNKSNDFALFAAAELREKGWLTDGVLQDVKLNGANLNHADLRGADLRGASLIDASLSDANLRHANLSGSDLSDADLSDANLRHANLSGSDLSRADLSRANLSRANLNDVILRFVSLSDADLNDADLSDADLVDADLVDADLRGADLRGADLSDADLRGVMYDESTIWPTKGFDAAARGAVFDDFPF